MTSKMLDWKIHPDLTRFKTIQYETEGYFYTSEEAWTFNPIFFESLD